MFEPYHPSWYAYLLDCPQPKKQNNRHKRQFMAYLRKRKIPYKNEFNTLKIATFHIQFTYGDMRVYLYDRRFYSFSNFIVYYTEPEQVYRKLDEWHIRLYDNRLWDALNNKKVKAPKICTLPDTMQSLNTLLLKQGIITTSPTRKAL